jgi:hypothetical protein
MNTRNRRQNDQKSWKPEPPFITRSKDFNMSEAFRGLANPDLYILSRLEVENMRNGGKENGRLVCPYDDFEDYGIRRPSIPAALRRLESRGLIEITQRGRRDARHNPHHYRLTYLPTWKGDWIVPTNEWRNYRPNEPKKQTKSSSARRQNQKPGNENVPGAGNENVPGPGNENVPMRSIKRGARKRTCYLDIYPSTHSDSVLGRDSPSLSEVPLGKVPSESELAKSARPKRGASAARERKPNGRSVKTPSSPASAARASESAPPKREWWTPELTEVFGDEAAAIRAAREAQQERSYRLRSTNTDCRWH